MDPGQELLGKGFTISRRLIRQKDCNVLYDKFVETRAHPFPCSQLPESVQAAVGKMLRNLSAATAVGADYRLRDCYFYSTGFDETQKSADFGWHQDHESYFQRSQHYHCVAAYITIFKEDPHDANLGVVPFDALYASEPMVAARAIDGGAARFINVKDRLVPALEMLGAPPSTAMLRIDDSTGQALPLSRSLDEIGVMPSLDVGDVLFFRQDCIHRTGNWSTKRVALKLVFTQASFEVSAVTLFTGSLVKTWMLANAGHSCYVDRVYRHVCARRIYLPEKHHQDHPVEQQTLLHALVRGLYQLYLRLRLFFLGAWYFKVQGREMVRVDNPWPGAKSTEIMI